MGFQLHGFGSIGLDEALLKVLLAEQDGSRRPQLERLWRYYRNPAEHAGRVSARPRQAQEAGLPARLVSREPWMDDRAARPEIVIENDIAWRVQAMVDFMFGKPVVIRSTARDAGVRAAVERVLDAVWEASGGIGLLQDAALLGHVYGTVDFLVRVDGARRADTRASTDTTAHTGTRVGDLVPDQIARRGTPGDAPVSDTIPGDIGGAGGSGTIAGGTGTTPPRPAPPAADAFKGVATRRLDEVIRRAIEAVRVEVVEATRGVPILDPLDYRRVIGYVVSFTREENAVERLPAGSSILAALRRDPGFGGGTRRRRAHVVEVLGPALRQVYEDGELVEEEAIGRWTRGLAPVAHVQNISQPFRYDGLSEVEPLIPLQDELNTRLSDRASRVTMQSFKMYLAKGLDGFERIPIGPGRVWSTDNMDASIAAFGGDADSPSEDAHIQEIREALDKVSAVPPLASGVVRARIGAQKRPTRKGHPCWS